MSHLVTMIGWTEMKTLNGNIIDSGSCRHKFMGDPMAEYLHGVGLMGVDRITGDCSTLGYVVQEFGRRLLFENDQGFVWVSKHDSQAEASKEFEAHDAIYSDWHDSEDAI